MPNILIVSAWYAPLTHPRPHRWTALAAYWAAHGHTVHVLTAKQPGSMESGVENGVQVHRCGIDGLQSLYGLWRREVAPAGNHAISSRQGILLRIFRYLYAYGWKRIFFPDDACLWYFPARRCAKKILGTHSIDLIITVSLPFTGHLIGLYLKKHFPKIFWTADIGDPFSLQSPPLYNSFFYHTLACHLEKKVLKHADKCVVTTPKTLELYLKNGFHTQKMSVAGPLLYPAPLGEPVHSHTAESDATQLWIYAGAFYEGLRSPRPLLALLDAVNRLTPVRLKVFGRFSPEVKAMFEKNSRVTLSAPLSREALREAYGEADCLLNIGNAGDFQLPSKIAELMASGKPVLHISPLEVDAFTEAWGTDDGLCRILIRQMEDVALAAGQWRQWWEQSGRWYRPDKKMLEKRIQPYLIENVARVYLDEEPVASMEQ